MELKLKVCVFSLSFIDKNMLQDENDRETVTERITSMVEFLNYDTFH